MENLGLKSKNVFYSVLNLEKKHKIITYACLGFLTITGYFLRDENQKIRINIAAIGQQNNNLIESMIIFNKSYEKFPLAIWQKVKRGNEFIYQYVNKHYVRDFGKEYSYDKYDFIGKTGADLYSKKNAQNSYESDLAVALFGEKLTLSEIIEKEDGRLEQLKVVKWRDIVGEKDTLVYGMIIDRFFFKN